MTPSNWCKHHIAVGLYKRATALVQRRLNGASNGQVAAAPDPVPATVPAHTGSDTAVETPQGVPQQHMVLIQGRPFVKFSGLLAMAHERGLIALTVDWTYNGSFFACLLSPDSPQILNAHPGPS